jgi:Family of unknown function (DUF6424)
MGARTIVRAVASPFPQPGERQMTDVTKPHPTTAGEPVTYETSGHPPRQDSKTYVASRTALKKISGTLKDWYFQSKEEPYQDHHGGGLWAYDDQGWFFVRNLVGIEWSGQFCADPAKVDVLRRNARRFYAGFPKTFAEFEKLGVDLKSLLETEIKTADDVARWTDSICNASVPLPQRFHTGFVPKGGGVHNYPTPVTDIDRFRFDDFQMWVTDAEDQPAAVVPVGPRHSGDSRVRVIHSTAGTKLHERHMAAESKGQYLELDGDQALAKQAFAKQTKK